MRYRVEVRVQIREENTSWPGLGVEENITIEATDFWQLAQVLAEFDAVAKKLQAVKPE